MQTNGSNIISMNINLGSMENRKRSSSEIADIVRADLKEYPEIHKGTVSEGMGGMGGAASVAVEIYGYDFQTTDRIANELRDKMAEDPAFAQVTLSRDQYTPEYQVDFDRVKLAANGLNSTTAAAAVSAAMSGSVGSYYERTERSTASVSVTQRITGQVSRILRISLSTILQEMESASRTSER